MSYRPEWDGGGGHGGFSFRPSGGWTATRIFIIACWAGFLLNVMGESLGDGRGISPVSWYLGLRQGNWFWLYPFATYVFPHSSTDILHVIFNTLILFFLGSQLESELGIRRYLGLFWGSALVGGVAYLALQFLAEGAPVPVIGVSGAVLGLIFYVGWATPNRQFILYFVPVRARTLCWIFLAINVFPLLTATSSASGVAYACHLGGALFGWLFWRFQLDPLSSVQGAREKVRQHSETRSRQRDSNDEAEMDRILAKISKEGITKLTPAERKFLDERSRHLRKGP